MAENPSNYDLWFDYARLEEDNGNETKIREVYERAISQVPPVNEKLYWRRYIYLWIFYAVWEESSQKVIIMKLIIKGHGESQTNLLKMHFHYSTQEIFICQSLVTICEIFNQTIRFGWSQEDFGYLSWARWKGKTLQGIH